MFAEGHEVLATTARQLMLRYRNREGKVAVTARAGRVVSADPPDHPGREPVRSSSVSPTSGGKARSRGSALGRKDTAGHPVAGADVVLALGRQGDSPGAGRTSKASCGSPRATTAGTSTVAAAGPRLEGGLGRPRRLAGARRSSCPRPGGVAPGSPTSKAEPIPCKVQFIGREGTASPDFGPDSGEHAVRNVYYSHDGRFRRDLDPGSYDVIVSYGPEYDAVFTQVDVEQGKESPLEAKLVRSVKTDGWISADFHSHASPSGDNTSSQLGRVLELALRACRVRPLHGAQPALDL